MMEIKFKSLINKWVKKKLRKFIKAIPQHEQEVRFKHYKSLGITFNKVLDIGAYMGTWKDMFKKIFPDSDILMIEANRKKEDILKKKGKYLIALLGSKDDETVNYFKCTDENIASGNSIFEENTSYKFEPEIRKTITLSTLLQDSSGFDLIKMDTQGSELSILEGGKEIVEKTKFLVLELAVVNYNLKSPSYDEVIKYLNLRGFTLVDIVGLHYRNGSLTNFDGFFVNTRFKDLSNLLRSQHI